MCDELVKEVYEDLREREVLDDEMDLDECSEVVVEEIKLVYGFDYDCEDVYEVLENIVIEEL